MEIEALKIKILKEIEATENLQKLSLVSKILEYVDENDTGEVFWWEDSESFKNELHESIKEADSGAVLKNEEFMNTLKQRSWRTK